MLSGKELTALNVQSITILTLKEFVAKFILNAKSSTKTSEYASNVMKDMDSTTVSALSFLLENKSTQDVKHGTVNINA